MSCLSASPKTIIAFTIIFTFFVPSLWNLAQESATTISPSLGSRADARLSRWFEANQPGAVVLLIQDGKVLFKKGYGLANVSLGIPIQPDMVFRIGSVTKQFTAAAIMLLVEEGKVDLQAPISHYLEKLPKTWKEATVEQLLNHTSGIPNYSENGTIWLHMGEDLTPIQLLEKYVEDQLLDFGDPPGTHYRYTNTGYILLGMIIEKVSGRSYADFLQKRLFEPLNLKHTGYKTEAELVPGMVTGYFQSSKPAPYYSMTQFYSSAGLFSNAEDLARWTLALHSGKVVKPESLTRMLSPIHLKDGREIPYGFGLRFRQSQGNHLVGHSGGLYGFTCFVEADPAAKAVAVILNNTYAPKWNEEYISRYLLALAAGKPLPELKPVVIEPSKLKRLAGRYETGSFGIRIITFDGKNLFNHMENRYNCVAYADLDFDYDDRGIRIRFERTGDEVKQILIPLSETEFGFEDRDSRLHFELAGDKVVGVYRRLTSDAPEKLLQKRIEPIEDKNPEVTTIMQQFIRNAIEDTLKPDLFTPNLAAQIFPDQVSEAAIFFKSLGPQTGVELYERQGQSSGQYIYRLAYGDKHVILGLAIVAHKRIGKIGYYLE